MSGLDIENRAAFREAIHDLVVAGLSNGVDVRGEWTVDGDDEGVWVADLSRVVSRSQAETGDPDAGAIGVVEAVAEREGVATGDLPALHDVVDTDILVALDGSTHGAPSEVSFTYLGYDVTYASDGSTTLEA